MPSVTKSIIIHAPIKRVFEVVSDFESYPEFLPEVKTAKIIKKRAKVMDVAFEIDIITRNKYTLEFILKPPSNIIWKLVTGDNMKSNDGSWDFEALDKGKTKVTYSAEINFGWLVPKQIAGLLIEKNLPSMLKNFKERSENKK